MQYKAIAMHYKAIKAIQSDSYIAMQYKAIAMQYKTIAMQ
jgi:hypothetical protein